jgi:biotin carboxyl carrier protein
VDGRSSLEERLMFRVLLQPAGATEPQEVALDRVAQTQHESHAAHLGERRIEVELESVRPGAGWLRIAGKVYPFFVVRRDDTLHVWLRGRAHTFDIVDRAPQRATATAAAGARNELSAPMPGKVLKVLVAAGDAFEAHQPLIVMESMKMEMTLSAPHAGTVQQIACAAGQMVEMGAVLARLDTSGDDETA